MRGLTMQSWTRKWRLRWLMQIYGNDQRISLHWMRKPQIIDQCLPRFIGRIVHSNCQKTFWTHGQSRITCSTTLRAKMNDNKLGTSNTSKRTTAVAGNRNCAPNCPARQPKTRVCPNSNLPPTNAIGQPSLERENEQRLRTRHAAGCAPFMAAQPSVDVALTPETS